MGAVVDDTAALVAELDCVVSVTTAIIHLCGAIGQKAYILVPERPRWFYLLEGPKVPWYNSVEMFRQRKGEWPVQKIANLLSLTHIGNSREKCTKITTPTAVQAISGLT